MLLFGIGALIGAAASVWVSKFVASLVYGVRLRDPVTLIGATVTRDRLRGCRLVAGMACLSTRSG
jgi:hypothetical protein